MRTADRSENPLNICVFCSSSDNLDDAFYEDARKVGKHIAARGWGIVYGGTRIGLMGEIARTVLNSGGRVTGVIPEHILSRGIALNDCTELIVTPGMSERKNTMIEISDVFIALPGGFGTLEEIMEVITLKQLQIIDKPVLFLNTLNYYQHLNDFFEKVFEHRFTAGKFRELYHMAAEPGELFSYIDSYKPLRFTDKWTE